MGSSDESSTFYQGKNAPAQLAFTLLEGKFGEKRFFTCSEQDELVFFDKIQPGAGLMQQQCSLTFSPPGSQGYEPCPPQKNGQVLSTCSQLFNAAQTGWPAISNGMACPIVDNYQVNGNIWTWTDPSPRSCGADTIVMEVIVNNQTQRALPLSLTDTSFQMEPFTGCVRFQDQTIYQKSLFEAPTPSQFDALLAQLCGSNVSRTNLPSTPKQSNNIFLIGVGGPHRTVSLLTDSDQIKLFDFLSEPEIEPVFAQVVQDSPDKIFVYGFGPCCNTAYKGFGTVNLSTKQSDFLMIYDHTIDIDSIGINNKGIPFATTSPMGSGPRGNQTVELVQLTPDTSTGQNYTILARYTVSQIGFQSAVSYFSPSLFFSEDGQTIMLIGSGALVKIDAQTYKIKSVVHNVPYIDRVSYTTKFGGAFFGFTFPRDRNLYGNRALAAISESGEALPQNGAFYCKGKDDLCDLQSCALDVEDQLFTCASFSGTTSIDVETLALTTSARSSAHDFDPKFAIAYTTFDPTKHSN